MTTTGEHLVSLSSVTTGSALAHLLAIQTGTGTGDSFYSGTIRVVTSQPEIFVLRKAARKVVELGRAAPRAAAPKKKARRTSSASVFAPQHSAYGFTSTEEVFVLVRSTRSTAIYTATNSVTAQRKKL